MSKQIIPYTTEAAWLGERAKDITSTESAALFSASPYVTAFELYHAKRDQFIEQRKDTPRMRWGRRLQDPIALGVAEDAGLEVRKMNEYIRDTEHRLGASFDFQIVGARGTGEKSALAARLLNFGEGLMEIKTVDPSIFKDSWVVADGEVVEAPPHIELQVQHQMLVSGMQWALIVALVGGNRVSIIERDYDAELGAAILKKVHEFWQLVEAGTPPSPDYTRDAAIIAQVYLQATAGKLLDAREDKELARWVAQYQELGSDLKALGEERDAMRSRIFERIGDASRIVLPSGSLSAGTVKQSVIPQHTRAAYRALRITNHSREVTA
jgi:predicted phage-related endonuclease